VAHVNSKAVIVSHSYMVHLSKIEVTTIEFVTSIQILVDPLTKDFAKDMIYKTSLGIGLRSIK
jgi:hypothetical protein